MKSIDIEIKVENKNAIENRKLKRYIIRLHAILNLISILQQTVEPY